jgi:hypothetical protein
MAQAPVQIDYDALADQARKRAPAPVSEKTAGPKIDYDALADQARKRVPAPVSKKTAGTKIDYDALAAQARQTQNPAPVAAIPPATPPPQEGFLASAAAPLVDTVKALIPHSWTELARRATPGLAQYDAIKDMLVKPAIEQGKQAVDEFKQANAQTPWYSMHPSPDAVSHRELALGHGLAAVIPGAGPWAAQLGQKEGEQFGAGNYSGAAGTAVGNILLALAPEILGKVPKISETLARAVTNTGAAPVKALVEDAQAANKAIDAVNQDRIEKQRTDQIKADADHRSDLLKLRQKYEQSVRDATEKARTGTAEDRAEVQSKNLAAKQKYEQDVRDAQQKHATDRAEALRANAEAQRAHNQKIGQTAQQNRAATAAERTKVDQEGKLQVGGSQLIYGLRQLDRALRARANQMYDAVREKMAGASLPSDALADIVRAAQEKWIRGSPEKVKEFNAMLSTGSPGPELTLADQTAQNMGYKDFQATITNPKIRSTLSRVLPPDVWEAAIGQVTRPISWNDLQGFYEETGARVADGPQPGKADIYKALQQVHDEIGNQMDRLAETRDMDKQFAAARKFYRGYMDTFHEPTGPSGSGSPVAQALLAKDPAVAVDIFAGDAGDRGIANLRSYSDSLANLAQGVRKTAQEKVTVPARKSAVDIPAPKVKPVPAGANLPLPGVVESPPAARAANLPLPPVIPEVPTVPLKLKPRQIISAGDIAAARKIAAEVSAGKWWNRGRWAAASPIIWAMHDFSGGNFSNIATVGLHSAEFLAGAHAISSLLRYPPMIEFLSKARPEDVAHIPLDLRGDLPGLVTMAQRQGIKVAPALAAMAGAVKQPDQQPNQSSIPSAGTVQPTVAGGTQ